MADPRRLTMADQALLHLAAYLAIETERDATWEAFRRELADILPRVNRAMPAIGRLAALCDRLEEPKDRAEILTVSVRLQAEIAAYHKAKAASAIEALREEAR